MPVQNVFIQVHTAWLGIFLSELAMREIAPSSWMWQKLNLHRTDDMRFYVLLPTSMDQKNSLEDARTSQSPHSL